MVKVAVTGATGFLGRVLVEDLIREGFSVVCLSRSKVLHETETSNDKVEWKILKYESQEGLKSALTGCDALVHLGGIAHSRAAADDEVRYERGIRLATESILKAATSVSLKTFIYASSIKVYGETSFSKVLTESDEPHPQSIYGRNKLQAEHAVKSATNDMRTIIFRLPPMYGPDMKGSVKYFFAAAKRNIPLPVHNFSHKRNFLFVGNASSLIIAGIKGEIDTGLFNVYDPISWKIGEFYKAIYQAVNGRPLPLFLKWKLPFFMENVLRKIPAFAALINPFELRSEQLEVWSRSIRYSFQQGLELTAGKTIKEQARK